MLSPEKQLRQGEIRSEKNKNKVILEKLQDLLELDKGESSKIYEQRCQQVSEKIAKQIFELRSLNFEKMINQLVGCKVLENMLWRVPAAKEIAEKIRSRNENNYQILQKYAEKYQADVAGKITEHLDASQDFFAEISQPLKIQERKVIELQDLLVLDSEFRKTYAELLNKETESLNKAEYESQLLILDKSLELLENLSLPAEYKISLVELRNKIVEIERYDVKEEISWELLPPGKAPDAVYGKRNGREENNFKTLRNLERVGFVASFQPEKIYTSKLADKYRNYQAYAFPTCVVLCSEWSNQALYVLPQNNWQELSKKDKGELRFRGAIQIKNVPGWREKLSSFIKGEVTIEVDEEIEYIPKESQEKIYSIEEVKEKVRKKILETYPDIQAAITSQKYAEARDLLKEIKFKDLQNMRLDNYAARFKSFRNLMMSSFPEADLSDSDFFIFDKKYRWKNTTAEEKASNVKDAIFSNFPEIKTAIEKGDYATARMWLIEIKNDDFDAIGLREISDGKVGDNNFNTRKRSLLFTFPEILKIEDFEQAGQFGKRQGKYASEGERFEKWGEKLRTVFMEVCPEIKKVIAENDLERAKLLIIAEIKKENSFTEFSKKNSIYGIMGVKDLKGGTVRYLELAFPEINWSEIKFQKGRKKRKL